MQRLPARTTAIAEMFFPVAAVGINWVALDASLSALQILGAAVLLAGSTFVALTQVDSTVDDGGAMLDEAAADDVAARAA